MPLALAFIVLSLFAGCAAHTTGQTQGNSADALTGQLQVQWLPHVIDLDEVADIARIDHYETNAVITLQSSVPPEVVVGSIVKTSRPDGVFGQVSTVQPQDSMGQSELWLNYIAPELAIASMQLHGRAVMPKSNTAAKGGSAVQEFRVGLKDYGNLMLQHQGDREFSFDGSELVFDPTVDVDWDFAFGPTGVVLNYLRLDVEAALEAAMHLNFEASLNETGMIAIPLPATLTIPMVAGPVPIVVSISMAVRLAFSGSGAVSIHGGAAMMASANAFAEYDAHNPSNPYSFGSDFDFESEVTYPTIETDTEASVRVELVPSVAIYVLGLAGPSLAIAPQLRFVAGKDDAGSPVKELFLGIGGNVAVQTNPIVPVGVALRHPFAPLEEVVWSNATPESQGSL